MIFPITDLLSDGESIRWIEQHFHPQGFGCPGCGASPDEARAFRLSKRGLVDYRCRRCGRVYNLYSETVFAGSGLSPRKVVLLLRGICKGESSASLAEELHVSRTTVHYLRQKVQAKACEHLSETRLPDQETETDEMFQNAGEKRRQARRPSRSAASPSQQTARARHV